MKSAFVARKPRGVCEVDEVVNGDIIPAAVFYGKSQKQAQTRARIYCSFTRRYRYTKIERREAVLVAIHQAALKRTENPKVRGKKFWAWLVVLVTDALLSPAPYIQDRGGDHA